MKRIAVIGLGKMGLMHASLLNTIPEVKVVALCEKSGLIRRFSKNIFSDVAMVENVSELSSFNLDAAYITTPPSSHRAILNTLLTQNICRDIFVEKPLAQNVAESQEMCNLPIKLNTGGIYMVGYNRRYSVTFQKAKELINQGVIGELTSFEGYAFSSAFLSGGSSMKVAGRGGVVKDLACHAIDLVLWYVGNISMGSILSSKLSADGAIDAASFELNTMNGLKGIIKSSWVEPAYRLPEIGFILNGEKGMTIKVTDDKLELIEKDGSKKTLYKHDLHDAVHFVLGGTEYMREDEAFIDAITNRKEIEPKFNTALKIDEIVQKAESGIIGQA